jgi:hypothetical protein
MHLRTRRVHRPAAPALLAVPGGVSTATAVTVHMIMPGTAPALVLATLSGLLALLGLLALGCQETARVKAAHRAELVRAEADAYTLRTVTDAATCGRPDTPAAAADLRRDARAYAAELGLAVRAPRPRPAMAPLISGRAR